MFLFPIFVHAQPWSMPNMMEVCKVIDCGNSIKEKVSLAFQDDPRMVDVITCESNHNQFMDDGRPLISKTSDVGVMQINQVHWSQAKKLELDIFYSIDDNIKMGRMIYDTQGIEAWNAIKSDCYKKLSGLKT